MRVHATVIITTCVDPSFNGKNFKKQGLSLLNLLFCRMYVHWREREHEDISVLVGEDPNVVVALM
jgi:hypothetical protein